MYNMRMIENVYSFCEYTFSVVAEFDNLVLFFFRMDCLIKTVKSEGYFGMYRGKTGHNDLLFNMWLMKSPSIENCAHHIHVFWCVTYFGSPANMFGQTYQFNKTQNSLWIKFHLNRLINGSIL